MTIVTRYNIVCDYCDDYFENGVGYQRPEDAIDDAFNLGWSIKENGATFCKECAKEVP